LKQKHPRYRRPTLKKIYDGLRSLKDWPGMGRLGREEGTRELLFPPLPYVVVYRVKDQNIEVVRVYHGARGRI